jgi:hypothetical protein
MKRVWRKIRFWVPGHIPDCCFILLFLGGGAVLLAALAGRFPMDAEAKMTLFSGLLAGGVVWWQVWLLVRQMAYGTVLDLYKEWNSLEMLTRRRHAWILDKECPNPETIEDVLEFLEKVSTLERRKYIGREFIWDTFGWYVSRYYFYCRTVIEEDLRRKWTNGNDTTLYQDLEYLYGRLVEEEASQRNLRVKDIEMEYDDRKGKFIQSEGK